MYVIWSLFTTSCLQTRWNACYACFNISNSTLMSKYGDQMVSCTHTFRCCGCCSISYVLQVFFPLKLNFECTTLLLDMDLATVLCTQTVLCSVLWWLAWWLAVCYDDWHNVHIFQSFDLVHNYMNYAGVHLYPVDKPNNFYRMIYWRHCAVLS